MAKKDKEKKIEDTMMYGDPFVTGPLIKAPDGDEKNKNIALILDGYKINIFVNKSNIRNYSDTAEITLNNLNHYYAFNKDYKFENIMVKSAYMIDEKIQEFILLTDNRSSDTDTEIIAEMVSNILIEQFLTDIVISRTKLYVDKFIHYDDEQYKDALANYQKSLDIDGVKISIIIGTLLKPIWFIMKRSINETKIKRKTVDLKILYSKITIAVFEACIQRCSYIYSTLMPDWNGEVYDFHTHVLAYFLERCDKAINDHIDFINRKHAVLGNTEASVLSSVYEAFSDILKKNKLIYAYKPGLIKGDVETFIKEKYKQQKETKDAFIYVPEMEMFGFNVMQFIKYVTISVDRHLMFNSYKKKEYVITSIAEPSKTDSGEGLSRRDKVLRKDDIINKEQKRINEDITKHLIRTLEPIDNHKYEIVSTNKVSRNILNMTLLPIFLDVLDVTIGNPLAYVNTNEFYKLLAAVSNWNLLEKYHTLSTALLCNKGTDAVYVNVDLLNKYCDEHFSNNMNRDIIYNTALSILCTKWSYMDYVKHDIEIDIHELFAFFKEIQELREKEDEMCG